MNKLLVIFTYTMFFINAKSQIEINKHEWKNILKVDTTFNTHSVYNFFTERNESIFHSIGSLLISPLDSFSLNEKNEYKVDVQAPGNGMLKISFKGYLLFSYRLIDHEINGNCILYYPFSKTPAVHAQFKKSKLHGLVITQSQKCEIFQIMLYRKGEYKKHLYHWLANSKRGLLNVSKRRSKNPLRDDEIITL